MKLYKKIGIITTSMIIILAVVFSVGVMAADITKQKIEAEKYTYSEGIRVGSFSKGKKVNYINNKDYIGFKSIDFNKIKRIEVSASSASKGGTIEIRKDAISGKLLGTINIVRTGSWNTFKTFGTDISSQTGKGNLYFVFVGSNDYLFDIDNFTLIRNTNTNEIKQPTNSSSNSTTSQPSTTTKPTTSEPKNEPDSEKYITYDPYYDMNDKNVNRAESEHFQIIWGNDDKTGKVNDAFIKGNLENLEKIRACYIEKYNWPEPNTSPNPEYANVKRKTNLYITETGLAKHPDGFGYMGTDDLGMGYLIIAPGGLGYDPPSSVPAHEYGHVVMYHMNKWNGSDQPIYGAWWETFAQWMADKYLMSDYNNFNGKNYSTVKESCMEGIPLEMLNTLSTASPNKDNYYSYYPFLHYLEENPDNINGLGEGFVKKMILESEHNEYPFHTIERFTPDTSIKDVIGNFAKRVVSFEWLSQKNYTPEKYNMLISEYKSRRDHHDNLNELKMYSVLQPTSNGKWSISKDEAPQQGGLNIIPLNNGTYKLNLTNASRVSVDFSKLPSERDDADFRVCLVACNKNGEVKYSSLWNKGVGSINIDKNLDKLYLVVAGTPDNMIPYNTWMPTDEPLKRMPYEVKITAE